MWVFGYGSLMYDGWQRAFDCQESVMAQLPGFTRSFTKKSVERWGSKAAPGPTLNLIAAPGTNCTGMAFRFDEARRQEIMGMLKTREGKNFELEQHPIDLPGTAGAQATIPIYRGRNLFTTTDPATLAAHAMRATGLAGHCRDYVDDTHHHLQLVGIDDPAVTAVWKLLQKLKSQQP